MRKFTLFGRVGTAFILMLLLTTMVAAQASSGLPGSGWYTLAVIQNVSATNGSLTLEAFPLTGTSTGGGTGSSAINAGRALVFRPDNTGDAGTVGIPGIASGSFQGSMVLSSDVEVVSVATLANSPLANMGVSGGKAGASYNGMPSGGTILTAPIVKSGFNGNTTSFFIQAAGQAATINAGQVVVVANNGVSYSNPAAINIEANKTYVLLTSSLRSSTNASMPTACSGPAQTTGAGCIGGITITSSAPIVGTVVEYIVLGSPAVKAFATNMFTPDLAGTTVYCPQVKNQFPANASGASSGISIQNATAAPMNITITIKGNATPVNPSTGNTYTYMFEAVPAGGSVVASRFANTLGGFPAGSIGAVTITAPGNVIAVTNEVSTDRDGATACIPDQKKTTKIAMPSVKFEFPSATNSVASNTGAIVQNVGATAADIVGTYSCRVGGGSTFTTYTVTKNAAAGFSAPFTPFSIPRSQIPTGQLCSVIFTSLNPLVAVANETTEGLNIPVRDSVAYEGFNLVP